MGDRATVNFKPWRNVTIEGNVWFVHICFLKDLVSEGVKKVFSFYLVETFQQKLLLYAKDLL